MANNWILKQGRYEISSFDYENIWLLVRLTKAVRVNNLCKDSTMFNLLNLNFRIELEHHEVKFIEELMRHN